VVSGVSYRSRPEVAEPVVLCAFAGWNDGGEGATTALRVVRDQWAAIAFASIDPEDYYDFQMHRPTVHLIGGRTRRIDWPSNEFSWARVGGRDVVALLGVEPNVRWRSYCEQILAVCTELGASVLVTLGAFLADVPHTIPSPVSASSSDRSWASRPGVVPAQYEGPTGIVGVLGDLAVRAGVPAVSIWAASPHYLPQTSNPKVALALLERLRDLVGLEIDTGEMDRSAREWQREVDEAIEQDGNLADYVGRLEEVAGQALDPSDVPSGEDLAAEFERYLRERGDD
jgi:proteasome assembly chaperone (PAC2) family protein